MTVPTMGRLHIHGYAERLPETKIRGALKAPIYIKKAPKEPKFSEWTYVNTLDTKS